MQGEVQTIEKLVDAATTDITTGLILILVLSVATAFIFIWTQRSTQNKIIALVEGALDNKAAIGVINDNVASVAEAQRAIVTAVNDQLKPISELADAWVSTLERTNNATAEALNTLQQFIDGVKAIALENKALIENNGQQHSESLQALHGKVDAMGTTEEQILNELKEMNTNLKALMIQIENTLVAIQDAAKKKTSEVETVNPEDSAPDAS